MSARVMRTLGRFTPDVEIYSIDEAFLDLGRLAGRGPATVARELARTVRRETGIPVSVGLGPTKVLAKIANRIAKRNPETGGVLDLAALGSHVDAHLAQIDVKDVWGSAAAGPRSCTAKGSTPPWTCGGPTPRPSGAASTWWPNASSTSCAGCPALELEHAAPPKQRIMTSRSSASG